RGVDVVAPDLLEHLLARDDLARALGERLEDHRLALRERLLVPVEGAAAESLEVELVAVEAQHVLLHDALAVPALPPQDRRDAREQLAEVEGLGEVVVAAGLEALHAVVDAAARREEQHRRVAAGGAGAPADLDAVEAGQHHVEQHEVPALAGHARQPEGAVAGDLGRVALGLQVLGDPEREVALVLDEQDAQRRAHDSAPAGAGCPDAAIGQPTSKRAPRPGPALEARAQPPCSSAKRRTRYRPSPAPPAARPSAPGSRWNFWNSRSAASPGKPTPLSATQSTASAPRASTPTSMRPPPSGATALSALSSRLRRIECTATGSAAHATAGAEASSSRAARARARLSTSVSAACAAWPRSTRSRTSRTPPSSSWAFSSRLATSPSRRARSSSARSKSRPRASGGSSRRASVSSESRAEASGLLNSWLAPARKACCRTRSAASSRSARASSQIVPHSTSRKKVPSER